MFFFNIKMKYFQPIMRKKYIRSPDLRSEVTL